MCFFLLLGACERKNNAPTAAIPREMQHSPLLRVIARDAARVAPYMKPAPPFFRGKLLASDNHRRTFYPLLEAGACYRLLAAVDGRIATPRMSLLDDELQLLRRTSTSTPSSERLRSMARSARAKSARTRDPAPLRLTLGAVSPLCVGESKVHTLVVEASSAGNVAVVLYRSR